MDLEKDGLLPPQRLAIAYAPPRLKERLSLLLQFDQRLSHLVAGSTEVLIGQLKLAWWRDAVAAGADKRPRGEPLMARLDALADAELEAALGVLIDAWEAMLVAEDVDAVARGRARAIFCSYTQWAGSTFDVLALGEGWARATLGDLAGNASPLVRDRALRPLSILALSVRAVSGPRLLWHALTGR